MMKQIKQAPFVLAAIFFVLMACSSVANTPAAPTQPKVIEATATQPAVVEATLTAAASATPEQVVEVTFKTPEEAITHYFEGVAQNNVGKILQACAINEMGEKFKLDVYVARLGNVMYPSQSLSPSDYPFYAEMNEMAVSSQILGQVRFLAYGLLSSEKVDDGSLITNMDPDRVNKFIQDVDPRKLSTIEIQKISPPNQTLMNDPKYIANAVKRAAVYGAEDSTERVALFSFEQNDYYIGFTLLRYGEDWKISSQSSPLANTDVLGAPVKISVDDFEGMINSQ